MSKRTYLIDELRAIKEPMDEPGTYVEFIAALSRRRQGILRLIKKSVNKDFLAVTENLVDRLHDVEDLLGRPMEAWWMLKYPDKEVAYETFVSEFQNNSLKEIASASVPR